STWRARRSVSRFAPARRSPISAVSRRFGVRCWPLALTSGPVAELVARGEAELGMQQIIAILPVAGAELVGPLPAELQNVIIYAAGLPSQPAAAGTGRAFLGSMRSEQEKQLMCANGLDPA